MPRFVRLRAILASTPAPAPDPDTAVNREDALPRERSDAMPVLFLIDECLHGTNSHDRRIGADAIVRGLVERSAIGLVTTHDLALTAITDALGPRAANVHFTDHFTNGKLRFDYELRPGVVGKGNALELMRSVGFDVSATLGEWASPEDEDAWRDL